MRIYSTKEISELFGVDNETVRRWIRTGELKAEQSSRKRGNIVYEKDLLNDYITKVQSLIEEES